MEQYLFRKLSSPNTDMRRNWKVLDSLMGKSKKSLRKEFIIDGILTTETAKICNSFCTYFIDHPKNIHESIPVSHSHHLDQIDVNDRTMYFRQATETEIVESIMQLNKEGGINDVSRKFLIMCKNHVSYYLKELPNFCIDSQFVSRLIWYKHYPLIEYIERSIAALKMGYLD